MVNRASAVAELSEAECWAQLRVAEFGRLATATTNSATQDLTLDVFPVNFVIREHSILFRTGPGSKMVELTATPTVAFQADGRRWRSRWSVVAHGSATRLGSDAEIEESGLRDLKTAHPSDKWNYVRIEVSSITGIRFRHR